MTPISKSYRLFSLPRWPEVLKNFPFPSFLTCTLGPLSALPSTWAYKLDLSVISVPTLKPSLFGAPNPHESWNWCPSAQGKEPAWPDPQSTPSWRTWALDPQKVRECPLPLILVFVGFCHHSWLQPTINPLSCGSRSRPTGGKSPRTTYSHKLQSSNVEKPLTCSGVAC